MCETRIRDGTEARRGNARGKEVGCDDQSMASRRLKIAKAFETYEAPRCDDARARASARPNATDQPVIDRMPKR